MTSDPGVPRGYASRVRGGERLVAREDVVDAFVGAGLDGVSGWERALAGSDGPRAGRGRTALERVGGVEVLLKRLRRGGALGALWRDRFFGAARIEANLTIPCAARARGVETPEVVAVVVAREGLGLHRGYVAVAALRGEDAAARLAAGGELPWRRLLGCVRQAHDAGLEHRDLNLGNLWIDADGGAALLDLDGARLAPGPLPERPRIRALWRLERSYRKLGGRDGNVAEVLRRAYAAGDAALERELGRAGWLRRASLAIHEARR